MDIFLNMSAIHQFNQLSYFLKGSSLLFLLPAFWKHSGASKAKNLSIFEYYIPIM